MHRRIMGLGADDPLQVDEEGVSLTIWKFPLDITDKQMVEMPRGARLLCVQMQYSTPCIWALVSPDGERQTRRIITRCTGHRIDEEVGDYIGTYQTGPLVFHVFDGGPVT